MGLFARTILNSINIIESSNYQVKVLQIRQLRNLPRQVIVKETNVSQPVTNDSEIKKKLDKKLDKLLKKEQKSLNKFILPPGANNSLTDMNNENNLPAKQKPECILPSFNFAAYVNKSESLQELIKLGVDLNHIERHDGWGEFVLKLNFENDIKPYLIFLNHHGVSPNEFGKLITKNPLLFKENMDDLETRINYLNMKKFSSKQIQQILSKNPFWLMFSTTRIDKRLGHFQETFKLNGDDVRFLAAKQPRLVTYNMEHIRKNTFSVREQMGFDKYETKCLLLSKPRLWMMNSDELVERFAYANNEMKLSNDMLIQFPEILTSRLFRIKQRHEFLVLLERAQYNPEKDLYISPKTLVEGTDRQFSTNVAKSDMKTYELFIRTR